MARSICLKTWEAKAMHEGRCSLLLRPAKYSDENTRGCGPGMVLLKDHHATPVRDGIGLVWTPGAHDPRQQPMPPDKIAEFCPYGNIGDELVFKESYARRDDFEWNMDREKTLHYLHLKSQYEGDLGNEWHWYGDWRPASTMPLWMCRLRRTIENVRFLKPCDLTRLEITATAASTWLESLDGRAYDNAEKAACRHTKSINPDATTVERCGILRACLDRTWGEGSWDRWFWAIGLTTS